MGAIAMTTSELIRLVDEARACIVSQKENGTYRGAKIGRMIGDAGMKQFGEIVLYRQYDNERACTVETPMPQDWITRQRAQGSLLTTVVPTIGVPMGLIEPVE
jgi:hypothetical protein